jgi:hypothetical protein
MRKASAFLVCSIMIISGVSAVEQSHPFSQIITQGPDNEGIDILDDMDMNDNPIHNTRALYIGGSGYSDGLAPGFIGHNSVEDRIALYSTTDKPVTVGFSPNAGIKSDLLVTGDLSLQGEIKGYSGKPKVDGLKIDSGLDVSYLNSYDNNDNNKLDRGEVINIIDGYLNGDNSLSRQEVINAIKAHTNSVNLQDGYYSLSSSLSGGIHKVWQIKPVSGDTVSVDGNLEADSKSFVHNINQTHEAVYTSQESASARAVIEGTATVEGGSKTVELPGHFEKVVSDDKPDIKVHLTPRELTTVAATERSQDRFTVETGKNSKVEIDYRVTAVREGFEDPEVVRRK